MNAELSNEILAIINRKHELENKIKQTQKALDLANQKLYVSKGNKRKDKSTI